jgi:hypothetical protein
VAEKRAQSRSRNNPQATKAQIAPMSNVT